MSGRARAASPSSAGRTFGSYETVTRPRLCTRSTRSTTLVFPGGGPSPMNRCADSASRPGPAPEPPHPSRSGSRRRRSPPRGSRSPGWSTHLLRASVDPDTAGFQVRRDHFSERIPPQTRLERHRDAQPGETERDVRRAATRMCGQCPASALPDQVDERLPDDNEHPLSPLDEIDELPRPRTGRAREGDARGIIVDPEPPSSQTRNEIQRLTLGVSSTNQRSGAPSLPRGHHQASTRPA